MDTISYLHLASVYETSESVEFVPIQINWEFLHRRKLSNAAAFRLLSVALTIGILNITTQVLAVEKVGSSGAEVANIQRCLKKLGFFNGPVTGKFATLTQRAVISFQQANRLTPDGVVGSATQTTLQTACQAGVNRGNTSLGLQFGSRSAAVSQLQRNLQQLGYFNSPNTGYFGSETQQAVIRFQQAAGILADGVVGSRTAQAISNALNQGNLVGEYPVLSDGSRGEAVTRLQQRLRELGYFNANPTGNFRSITKDAVIAFQRRSGLSPTGIVNWETWNALLGFSLSPTTNSLFSSEFNNAPIVEYNSSNRFRNNPYVVVVPITNADTFNQVRRYIPNAVTAKSRLGNYVNAGAFSDRPSAEQRAKMLRSNGVDARVQYFN